MTLAFDFMANLPMIVVLVGAIGMLLAWGASWAHAHNHDLLAGDLDVAHEALDVVAQVGQLVASGKKLPDALAQVGPSDEAKDLLRRFKVFAHLAVALLAFMFFAGCASPAEDYVRAEAAAWAQIDPSLDGWIDAESSFKPEKKDALHQLNAARRARVKHALEAFEPPVAAPSAAGSSGK